jgi:hypothetical protein
MNDKLADAIELVRIGAGATGYRSYPGTGGVWAGGNDGIADVVFSDWGLARATAEILNAVLDGRLTSAEQLVELDAFVATHQYTLDKNPPPLWPKDSVLMKAITHHEARQRLVEQ